MSERQPTALENDINSFAIKAGGTAIGGALTVSFGLSAIGSILPPAEPLSVVLNGVLCAGFAVATKYGYAKTVEARAQIAKDYVPK